MGRRQDVGWENATPQKKMEKAKRIALKVLAKEMVPDKEMELEVAVEPEAVKDQEAAEEKATEGSALAVFFGIGRGNV